MLSHADVALKIQLAGNKNIPPPNCSPYLYATFFSLFLFVVLNLGPAKSILGGAAKPCLGHRSN